MRERMTALQASLSLFKTFFLCTAKNRSSMFSCSDSEKQRNVSVACLLLRCGRDGHACCLFKVSEDIKNFHIPDPGSEFFSVEDP
jgi:hypothetical protein